MKEQVRQKAESDEFTSKRHQGHHKVLIHIIILWRMHTYNLQNDDILDMKVILLTSKFVLAFFSTSRVLDTAKTTRKIGFYILYL